MTFGERLRQARQDVAMKSNHLAQAADVPRSQLHGLEGIRSGRQVSAVRVYELAKATGVRMEDLLNLPYLGQPIADDRWPGAASIAALDAFMVMADISTDELWMLSHVNYHGRQPLTAGSWRYLWEAIRRGCMFDHFHAAAK